MFPEYIKRGTQATKSSSSLACFFLQILKSGKGCLVNVINLRVLTNKRQGGTGTGSEILSFTRPGSVGAPFLPPPFDV